MGIRRRRPLGEVIAVLSGKGGTGKTSVCAGIATALAESGSLVLCIDCDVGLQNLDISLGLSDNGGLSFLDVCDGGYTLDDVTRHPKYPTLSFLTAPMNRAVEKIELAPFSQMLRTARKTYDYIFLDAPAGVDAGFKLVSAAADRFLVVTGPSPAAIRDAARVADILELMGKQNIRLIVNRVDKNMLDTLRLTIDDIMDTAGLPLAGVILEDANVTLAAAFGRPLLQYAHRSTAAKAFRKIARRIQGFSEPVTLR